MKIRLITLMAGPEGVFPPGSVIEVSPEEACALIAGGYAEPVLRQAAPAKEEPPASLRAMSNQDWPFRRSRA
jgi:hypothetical protein